MRTSGTFWHHVVHRKSKSPHCGAGACQAALGLTGDSYTGSQTAAYVDWEGLQGGSEANTLIQTVRKSRLKESGGSPRVQHGVSGQNTSNPP